MAHIYFHCCSELGVLVDRRGADCDDLIEVHDHAWQFVGSLIAEPGREDWRQWVLRVSDEIFEMPFASVLGKLH